MEKKNNIILIGFMGGGKTSIGLRLSKRLHHTFLDTDDEIVAQEHRSINEIFAEEGEPYFRDLETAQLKELLVRPDNLVISVGGGLPMREENRTLLKQLGTVIFLQANTQTLVKRLQGDDSRPMLAGYDLVTRVDQLKRDRMAAYLDAADICLETDDLNLDEVTSCICERIQCVQ